MAQLGAAPKVLKFLKSVLRLSFSCTGTPEVKSRFISFPDMKPEKLLKGAALKQIETFVQTFEHYMAQGFSSADIPSKAVYPVLLLVIDASWKKKD